MVEHGKAAAKIRELVNDLSYSSDIADELVKLVYGWKDETSQGKPFLDLWYDVLQSNKISALADQSGRIDKSRTDNYQKFEHNDKAGI